MPKHSREITLSPPPSQPAADPPYLFAAATAVVIFAIYALTLSPTTAFWDTSEYIAAAKVLGIPHPPGNPLFVVLAHVWGLLPIAANYAKRINYFAAFTSAAGAGFWFLIAERWLRRILPARGPRLAAAFAGIFAAAVTWTVWNQSTVNEKVYTVSMLSIALIVWCMVLWADMPDSPRRNGLLILAAYLTALTSTNHQMGVLALPAIGMYVLLVEPRLRLKPWVMLMAWVLIFGASGILGDALTVLLNGGTFSNPVWALTSKTTMDGASAINALIRITALLGVVAIGAWGIVRDRRNPLLYVGVLAVIAGLALNYVWLPLRAAQHPALNEGEPTGFFSQALSDVLNRVQYAKAPVTQRMSPFSAQLSMYWHYWSWQWSRDIGGLKTLATGIFTALCAWGATKLVRRERRGGVVAATMLITLTVLLIFYLNFRYQYGTPGIPGVDQEVRQRDYFFVASFAFSGVLLAAGFAAAIRAVADWLGDRVGEPRRWIAGTPVLLLALIPLIGNRLSAPRNHETLAGDFAVDMLQSVAPYGILITQGDNDTFPLWFAQEVLGVRRDVTLANLSLMSTDWHLNQLKRRATPMFDPGGAAKVWQRGSDSSAIPLTGTPATRWTRPTESVLAQQSQGQIDSLQQQYRVTPGDSVQLGKDLWAKWG
ncbi:MAG: glycosyltransferase family 117 protein, partial [Gemmatimonadales bacterium]